MLTALKLHSRFWCICRISSPEFETNTFNVHCYFNRPASNNSFEVSLVGFLHISYIGFRKSGL